MKKRDQIISVYLTEEEKGMLEATASNTGIPESIILRSCFLEKINRRVENEG